jgi:hypothetical protein
MQLMKRVRLMSLLLKRRAKRVVKVDNHVAKANPRMKINPLPLLVAAHLSSMLKQAGKAIKIANTAIKTTSRFVCSLFFASRSNDVFTNFLIIDE